MNFFDFLMAMSRNAANGGYASQQSPFPGAGAADTGFMNAPSPLAPWINRFGPATPGAGGQARDVAQQGLVGGQLPGLQFNGGGGVPDMGGRTQRQAAPAPATSPPQFVGGQLPGIQFNSQPPALTYASSGGTRNTRSQAAAPPSRSSSNTSSGASPMYNNFLSQGYQPLQFGGG